MSPVPCLLRAAALLCLAGAVAPLHAISCHVRNSPLSPGDIAMSHGDYAKAEALYADESKSGTDADRLHVALIRVQIRQSKVEDARKDALAWSTSQPGNPWALVALAEVQWREGRPDDSIQTLNKSIKIDFCNPQAHADSAMLFRMLAMYASANSELTLARKLDPIDPQIEFAWLRFQPPATRLAEITSLLGNATYLSAEQINAFSREKHRLFDPPPPAACHLVTPASSTSIPFRAIEAGQNGPQPRTYWGLDVSFDGKQRRLEIDTGASGLILSKSAANALHLEPERTFKMGGVGDEGLVDSFIAKVKSIKIGGLEFQDCYVQVLGKNPPEMSAQDGLIGGDVFSQFLLTLDFPGRTLHLDPLPVPPGDAANASPLALDTGIAAAFKPPQDSYRAPAMKDWDHVWRSGKNIFVPVGLNSGTSPRRLFLLDTGSAMDLISPDAAREVGKVSKGSYVNIVGISGKVDKTWTTGPMKLYFSHFVAPSQGLIAIDTSHLATSSGTEISGLIGAPTLHQFTLSIDYRDNLVNFNYDPKRIAHCVDGVRIADCY